MPRGRHGHALDKNPSVEYQAWQNMKARCLNPNNPQYGDYGGRGIQVSERWLESFDNFLADMGPRPPGMSLDRIDNDGDYSRENCRWADRQTQNTNKRQTLSRAWLRENCNSGCECICHA